MSKFDDNDFLNNDVNLKFESNVEISLLKKVRKVYNYNYNNDQLISNWILISRNLWKCLR